MASVSPEEVNERTATLYKPDEAINPKFMKQASMASMQSTLSLLPQWQKVKPSGGMKKSNMQVAGTVISSPPTLMLKKSNTSIGSIMKFANSRSSSSMNLVREKREDDPRHLGGICSGDELRERGCMQRLIFRPHSWCCYTWDIMSCVFMTYEIVIIPLAVFALEHPILTAMDWFLAVVWSLDICFSFLRGVDIGGYIELRPSRIARRYLRGWFGLDAMLVGLDWSLIFTASDEDLEFLKGLRVRRVLRLLRITRLLRFLKLASKEYLREFVHSEKYIEFFSIGKLLVVIWVVNHYVACGWYGIGLIPSFHKTWVANLQFNMDEPSLYHYTTALHWSMTQFTPASMEVVPTNTAERIYTILAIFAGLVVFSSFVSNMTRAMTSFQQLTSEQRKQTHNLRQFLATHKVSMNLVESIIYFIKSSNARTSRKRLHEADVSALKILPENLLARLHAEVYGNTIANHPLFQRLRDVEDVCFANICNLAMSERSLLIGEELFRCGVNAVAMYFVVDGSLSYFPGYDEVMPIWVGSNDWLCECSLWAKWEHKGRLTTDIEVAEFMCLDAHEFRRVILQTRSAVEVQRYAQLFCSRAVADCGGSDQITDLYGRRTIVDAIARKAFSHGDNSHLINKAMMLWRIEKDDPIVSYTFMAWKHSTKASRRSRVTGLRRTRSNQ